MSDEEDVPLVNEEELFVENDISAQAIPIGPPPDYESSLQPITIPAPPYPGADIELPDYCDVVVTRAPTNQPIRDDTDSYTGPINEQGINIPECLSLIVLLGCAVVAIILFAPLGVVALFLSVVATKKWHYYKEQSIQRKTAIGCILLAFVVGIPVHVVIWRHLL